MRKKITLEMKKKAVEIAIAGGDHLQYLKDCGSGNPSAAWFYIRKTLKESDPEAYEKLMRKAPAVDVTIDHEALMADAQPGSVVGAEPEKETGRTVAETAMENVKEIRRRMENAPAEISGTDGQDDLEIIAINTCLGGFQTAGGRLCWYPKEEMGKHYVNLALGDWKRLMALIPKVMSVMKLEN